MLRERKQISICIVAVMLVADFVLFGYLPSYERLKGVEQARAEQRAAIVKAAAEAEGLAALKQRLTGLQKVIVDYEKNIPEKSGIGGFLQKIAEVMDECNLQEQHIQPGKEIKTEGLCCIPVKMQCKGGLDEIFRFYVRLQNLDRLVRIESVELVNDRDFNGEISMQTKADIYYRTRSEQK